VTLFEKTEKNTGKAADTLAEINNKLDWLEL
jgi:hypothetical protein